MTELAVKEWLWYMLLIGVKGHAGMAPAKILVGGGGAS